MQARTRSLVFVIFAVLAALPLHAQEEGGKKKKKDQAESFFREDPIPQLRIEMAKAEMDALNSKHREYVPVKITESMPGAEERVYTKVGIHLKGAAGSFRLLGDKPALTLNFDKFEKGQRFHGLDKIHLNNSVQDGTFLHEAIAAYVFQQADIPAPRVTHARVWLNERDLGLYVLKEGFDGSFLKLHFDEKDGVVYEGNLRDVDSDLVIKPAERKDAKVLMQALVASARESNPETRRKKVAELLEVEKFVDFLACENLLAHWDGYGPNRNNYRIYLHPRTGKMTFMPQGLDQVLQQPGYALVVTNSILSRAVAEHPEDRKRFMERVRALRETVFDPDKLHAEVDRISARLHPVMQEMSENAGREHKNHVADLKRRISERTRNIDRQLGMPAVKFDGTGSLAINKGWEAKIEGDKIVSERKDEQGKAALYLKLENGGAASWRTPVELPQGKYTFEGRIKIRAVEAGDGTNMGAGLRISGGQRPRKLTGDSDWQAFAFEFEIGEASREVVLVCELRGSKGEAWYELESLKIRKR